VALAEQGALRTGVDLVERSLLVARERCAAHCVIAAFHCANATDVHRRFAGEAFDLILFFAALEHMTHAERIAAMRSTWEMLPPGGLWGVIETPNRLWPEDRHTSLLPFYHWLPDDLAYRYSRFSPRRDFAGLYTGDPHDATMTDYLRRGRGVSYHGSSWRWGRWRGWS
jgi:S-adenosylmethionine-dependent methyltransferase